MKKFYKTAIEALPNSNSIVRKNLFPLLTFLIFFFLIEKSNAQCVWGGDN